MNPALAAALAIVRGWTRLYTAHMPSALRAARRAEIESDLWEFHEDARRQRFSPPGIAILMVMRLALGVHDDLLWRIEHRTFQIDLLQHALWAAAIASVGMLWLTISTLQTKEPPLSPVGSSTIVRMLYPARMYPAPLPRAPLPAPTDIIVHVTLRAMPPPPPPTPEWR